jgi:hypothetical protein
LERTAEWLKGVIKEVPVEFIAAAEPFRRPDKTVEMNSRSPLDRRD